MTAAVQDAMPKDNYLSQYKSPNIVIIPAPLCYPPSPKRQKAENEMDNYLSQYKSPNIVIIPAPPCYPPSPKRQKAKNEMDNYFSRYKSPNTVIIPAPLRSPPSPKRQKAENEMQSLSPQHVDLSFLDDFNIDEIVECLNNCDNNDNTAQENSGVNHTPDELVKVSENRLNTNDNDQKFDKIELESTKKPDTTLNNEENELITNILYNNNSDRITETNTLRSDSFNTQSDSTAVENTVKNTTCTEAKIIEKGKEQDSTDHTKPFNTQSDSTADNTVKNTTCTEAKIIEKGTEQDSTDHTKPFNTQSDSTAVENTVKNTTCTEAKIIEKGKEQDSTDHTKPFNTQSDSTAVDNTVKNTTCTEAKIIEKGTEQDSTDHTKPFNTQSDSTAVENTVKNTTCTEAKIIEKDIEQDSKDHTKPFNTQSDSTAVENTIKNTTCTEAKIIEKDTEQDSKDHTKPFNTQSDSTAVENTVKNTTCTEARIIEKDTEQDSKDHTKPFNTQSDSTAVENAVKNTTCMQAKIIEKGTEQDSADHIKPLHNVNKNEHIIINSKDCQDKKAFLNNKPNVTKIDNTNESQDNIINFTPKNTTYIVNPVVDIKSKVLNEDKELMKERTKSTKSLKSVVSKADNNLYQKLENRMFDYIHKKYCVESVIHYGQFSKILKCKDSSGKQYAIKMLNKQSDWFFLGINKDKMLMSLQAEIPKENLFLVYCSKSFSFNRYWCFLMDFYPKNLKQALEESPKPFHIDLVQELARQLVSVVTLLRNNNVVHSDIKPSHILLNSSQNCLKLCGFDSAYYIEEASIKPNIGSVNYRPPEVILGYSAGFSVDVWCTALVLYEMITGTQLFPGDSNLNILNKQICEFGNIPPDMLSNSHYTSRYFIGGIFRKRLYFKETAVFTNNFNKNKKLYKTVYAAYYDNWESSRTKIQKLNDFKKIKSLLRLLVKMLTIHPKYRITIEFVYANPFVYEIYDC